ncbi:MAG: hypothetical protein OEM59_18405 [Rhodospirillales bacterium]|nr:hypothetical protein [Rhodospirillales bacterium]
MHIIGKRADGYLLECNCRGHRRNFVVKTLGLEVRCPTCGRRECALDLTTSYVFMQRASRIGQQRPKVTAPALNPVDVANDYVYMRRIANHCA